jgi:hypothetical protein
LAVQDTYSTSHGFASLGAQADDQLANRFSLTSANADDFTGGLAVVTLDGGETGTCALPTSTADVDRLSALGGVSMRVQFDVAVSNDLLVYSQGDSVTICNFGVLYVLVDGAVGNGETAYVRFAAGSGSQLGAFRADDDSATAQLVPGLRFLADGTSGSYVPMRINLGSN